VIECVPTGSAEVVKIISFAFTTLTPIRVFPSIKVTVPEGFSIPCDVVLTLAINVIGWPDTYSSAIEVNSISVSNIGLGFGLERI
jgi:hypothetical protein